MNIKPVLESAARNVLCLFSFVAESGVTYPKVNGRKASKAVARCEKCKVTFLWQPKCPSCSKPVPVPEVKS
jgi:hypothetical protein